LIQKEVHEEANIIWGTAIDESMGDELRVTVVATGINPKEERVVLDFGRIRAEMSEVKPDRSEDRETPTFVRKGKEIDKYGPRRPAKPPEYYFDEEELEVPTFIRKGAD